MARLIESGQFEWSTPVGNLSSGFALADKTLAREMQMRHTVNASTGIPRRDLALTFRFGGVTPEQRLQEIRGMIPTTGFGETFQYSNHLVALGGYAASRCAFPDLDLASGYSRAMQELVFNPLGMGMSSVGGPGGEPSSGAQPHAFDFDGGVSKLEKHFEHFVDAVAPAGAVWSTAGDMAQYLMLELSAGTQRDGRRLVAAAALARRRTGGVKITETESYGLGLMCNTEYDVPLLHHGGNTLGFTSDMFFLPKAGFGAVILANLGGANGFREAVRRRLLELAFNLDEKATAIMDISANASKNLRAARHERIKRGDEAVRWLDAFVGDYDNPALGPLTIHRKGQVMWAKFSDFDLELGMDVRTEARLIALLSSPFSGTISLRPSRASTTLVLSSGQEEYEFTRQS